MNDGTRRRLSAVPWLVIGTVLAFAPATADGQLSSSEESRLLREAARAESAGDYAASVEILTSLLAERPASSGAIFALERVLRAQGRVSQVLDPIDAFLAVDPVSTGPRYLKLRILLEVDSLAELRSAAQSWIAQNPASPDSYREVARVYERAFGGEEALSVLRRGQNRAGGGVLAVEAGDVLLRLGRPLEALMEWAGALDGPDAQAPGALRRMVRTGGEHPGLASAVVRELAAEGASETRRRAAIEIALEARLQPEALSLAEEVAGDLPEREREGFLNAVLRLAEEKDADQLALWTLQQLRRETPRGSRARTLDRQIAVTSLVAGDTVRALEARERYARGLPERSPERRRALAEMIRLETATGAPLALLDRFAAFREEFPNAPEADPLAVALSARFRENGDLETAAFVLEGVQGPLSAQERAWLALEASNRESARINLMLAARGLPATEATAIVQLIGVLDRVGEQAAALAGRVSIARQREGPDAAFSLVNETVHALPPDDQPPLLAMAARIADEIDQQGEAARLRESLAATFPESSEAPEAILQLARYRATTPTGVPAAIELLEELILARPNSAVVPVARRELERLRASGGAS
ncbi:MAG: hypothetical protein F4179_10305 [Gammaproteobacteria bacterium]|nr:hypothetical protein [Gammaproteobacteria bacterium]MYF62046.1 hypothetical protein [Gammaproteobacteria bacterium]MYI21480.1 hypothetical protein [Gammaproteobacteria bacterium]